jgi:hypothetical protein
MFDPHSRLFCYRLKRTERGLVQEGLSRRYTIITLLGLSRLEQGGIPSPIETKPVLEGLLSDLAWADNMGDIGLLLWLCALTAPGRLSELEKRLDVSSVLLRYRDARQRRTMELAWFLSGLSHWSLARPEKLPTLRDQASMTYAMLSQNQRRAGLFGHLATDKSISGRARGWIGSFADQVYPVYALTKFSQAYQHDGAMECALDCALTLCQVQGPLGQWWWHYNSRTGHVVEQYPVFSVHQHGMGPMALIELGDATGYDFKPSIYRGIDWIHSCNELNFEMEDTCGDAIWRCMCRPVFSRYWDAALRRQGQGRENESPANVRILFECRPYELGWLLYAFAQRAHTRNKSSGEHNYWKSHNCGIPNINEHVSPLATGD